MSMELVTRKKNFLEKTWKRCRSFPCSRNYGRDFGGLAKSKSWNRNEMINNKNMAPHGFFPVYVGLFKQRFSIKTKYVNHPLFITLLEDAEMEYGYNCDGPISLSCDVDLFHKVLAEMEAKDVKPLGLSSFNPRRRLGNKGSEMRRGYCSYGALSSLSSMN